MEAWGRFFNAGDAHCYCHCCHTSSLCAAGDQQEPGSASSLFIALFANGDALVEQNVVIENPLAEEARINLFGDIK